MLVGEQATVSNWAAPQVVQAEQTRSVLPAQAPVSWVPAPHTEQLEQVVSLVGPQEAVRNWPALQLPQAMQTVSCVAEQAAAWYWPAAQVEQVTQTPPLRKVPGRQVVQAPTPVQALQSTSHPAQVASLVVPQVAVWYCPPPQTVQLPQVVSVEPPQAAV